jgi:cytochrome c biogenesis protein CcdA
MKNDQMILVIVEALAFSVGRNLLFMTIGLFTSRLFRDKVLREEQVAFRLGGDVLIKFGLFDK